MDVTVILCTHNPRPEYLRRALAGLQSQTLPREHWDLLVIDNCSDTVVEDSTDLSWHEKARIVREEALGLTRARLRGIRESHGQLLVFVDDDNVLYPDYLATAKQIAHDRQFLGSWSGQCVPEFESPPPEWTRRYWGSLVIRQFDNDVWSNMPRLADSMPCGAGLCVRRAVAERYLMLHVSGQRSEDLDRRGSILMSGGDNDLAACACDLGMGVGLIASLKLTHLIPAERLTLEYLCKVCEGIHYSGELLDHYRGIKRPDPSIARKIVFWLRLPFLQREHAAISQAVSRGKRRARQFLAHAEQ